MEDTFLLEKEGKSLADSPQTGTHHPASRCQMGIQGLGFCRMQLMKGNATFLSSMDKMGQKAAARSLVYCSLQRKHIHMEHPLISSVTAQIRPWQTSTLALDASNRQLQSEIKLPRFAAPHSSLEAGSFTCGVLPPTPVLIFRDCFLACMVLREPLSQRFS